MASVPMPPLIPEYRILPLCGRDVAHAAKAAPAGRLAELRLCGAAVDAAAGSSGRARAQPMAAAAAASRQKPGRFLIVSHRPFLPPRENRHGKAASPYSRCLAQAGPGHGIGELVLCSR